MKLSLAAFEADTKECTLETAPDEIDLAAPPGYAVRFEQEICVHLRGRRVGEEFFFAGHIETGVVCTCVRCLTEFPAPLKATLDLVIHRVKAPQPSDGDLDSYVELPVGTTEFELGPYAREALLLAVPETPHCRDECKGLCAHCGVDLNRETCTCQAPAPDPRWDGLRSLSSVKR